MSKRPHGQEKIRHLVLATYGTHGNLPLIGQKMVEAAENAPVAYCSVCGKGAHGPCPGRTPYGTPADTVVDTAPVIELFGHSVRVDDPPFDQERH